MKKGISSLKDNNGISQQQNFKQSQHLFHIVWYQDYVSQNELDQKKSPKRIIFSQVQNNTPLKAIKCSEDYWTTLGLFSFTHPPSFTLVFHSFLGVHFGCFNVVNCLFNVVLYSINHLTLVVHISDIGLEWNREKRES